MKMYTYTFNNGEEVFTSKLSIDEVLKRMDRLSNLMCLTREIEDNKHAENIYKKALRAYNKTEDFTGIIRLTFSEKDWLSYCLENSCITDKEIETVKFYCKIKD